MVSAKTVLVSVALVAYHLPVAWTSARRPAEEISEEGGPRTARIISTISDVNLDGSYTYGFEATDGSYRKETRKVNGEISGEYGYIDKLGLLRTVVYGANRRTRFGFEPSHAIGGIPLLHPSFDQPAAAIVLARPPYTQIQRNSEESRSRPAYTQIQRNSEESRSSDKNLGFSDADFTLPLKRPDTEATEEDDEVEIYHPEIKSIEGRRAVVANRARRPLGRRRVKLLDNGKKYVVLRRERNQKKEEVMQDSMETDTSHEDSESKHNSNSKYDSEFSLNENMSREMTNLKEKMIRHQNQIKEEQSKPEIKDGSEMRKKKSFIARADNNRLVRVNPFKARQVTFGQRYRAFIAKQKALKTMSVMSLLEEDPVPAIVSNSLEDARKSRKIDINHTKSRNIVVDQNFSIQLPLKHPMNLKPSFN